MSPLVISASRRTDIPALHAKWLLQRVRAGQVWVRNPLNAKQISQVSLRAEDVAALILWTRWPRPLRPFIDEICARCAAPLWLCTVTAYDRSLESRTPTVSRVVDELHYLAQRYGRERVRWRYDPIVMSARMPASFHVQNFARLCELLHGATRQCHVSFVDLSYAKVQRRLLKGAGAALRVRAPNVEEQTALLQDLWLIGQRFGIEVVTCSQPQLTVPQGELFAASQTQVSESATLTRPALLASSPRAGACIDGNWIKAANPNAVLTHKKLPTRSGCLCHAAKDIGAYDTCSLGCLYCYATRSDRAGCEGRRSVDVDARLLGANTDFEA